MRIPRDPLLFGYLIVMLAGLTLTSVATLEFFSYLLPFGLALAATIVMAAGLPLLKFASEFDRQHRTTYGRWLWGFLVVELVAQYFKAQANFSSTVAGKATLQGTDIAAAAANGYVSRILAFVFLASLPFVVVGMCHATAQRWRTLRAQGVRHGWGRWSRIRARVARLRRSLAQVRADLAQTHAALTDRDALIASLHTTVAELRAWGADLQATLTTRESDLAQTRAQLKTALTHLADRERLLTDRDAALARLTDDLAQERARPILTADAAVQLLIAAGAPEATIRGWLTTGRVKLDGGAS